MQLRPKVESYHLSVQSGGGHNLNASLFERLVTSGFPHASLTVQHRMHPDISELVRECTYPYLQDSSSVTSHPPILGVPLERRRVIFLDHNESEVQERGSGWGADTFQSKVKSSSQLSSPCIDCLCVRILIFNHLPGWY